MYKIIKIFFILLFTYSCSSLPGINEDPKEQKKSKAIINDYTINDINISIIDINKLKKLKWKPKKNIIRIINEFK